MKFKIICIAGEAGVGKTCLLSSFVGNQYTPSYIPIGIDFQIKDQDEYRLQIWDLSGQERFSSITQCYFKGAKDGVIICYDTTNEASFNRVSTWVKKIRAENKEAPFFLVGTKADLVKEKKIDAERGQACADAHGFAGFMEVSAKTGFNVDKLFGSFIPTHEEIKIEINQIDSFIPTYKSLEEIRTEINKEIKRLTGFSLFFKDGMEKALAFKDLRIYLTKNVSSETDTDLAPLIRSWMDTTKDGSGETYQQILHKPRYSGWGPKKDKPTESENKLNTLSGYTFRK